MSKKKKKKELQLGRLGPLSIMRRYNQQIMVVAGVLLMIAFLIPQALRRLGSNQGRRITFYLEDKPVRGKEYMQAQRELGFLQYLGVNFDDMSNTHAIDSITGAEHWIMLKRLAQAGGYVVSIQRGRDYFTLVPPGRFEKDQEELLRKQLQLRFDRSAARIGFTPEDAGRTAALYAGVMHMFREYDSAARVAPVRSLVHADKLADQVVGDLLFVDSSVVMDRIEEPDEQTLADLCYQYRNAEPGSGEFGFGYRQPAEVKFEYMEIKRDDVAEKADVDRFLARKYFLEHRDEFAEAGQDPETIKYADVRDKVYEKIRYKQVDERLKEIERFVTDGLNRGRKGLSSDTSGLVLPDDWAQRRTNLEDLASLTAKQFGISLPSVVRRAADWIPIDSLKSVDSVEGSYMPIGRSRMSLRDILEDLREISGKEVSMFQVGVAFGPLIDEFGNRYFVRVLAARPERPVVPDIPADAADPEKEKLALWQQVEPDVKEQVRNDARRLRAFRILEAEADKWRSRALDEGLETLAKETGSEVVSPVAVAEETWDGEVPSVAKVGKDRNFITALHDVVRDLDPKAKVAEVLDLPQRTVVRPIPGKQGLAIAVVTDRRPLTLDLYRLRVAFGGMGSDVLMAEARHIDADPPYSFPVLEKRLGFRSTKKTRKPAQSAPEGASPEKEDVEKKTDAA